MAKIPILDQAGATDYVATTTRTRDGVTEHYENIIPCDPTNGNAPSVVVPGTTGAAQALVVQVDPLSPAIATVSAKGIGPSFTIPTGNATTPPALGTVPSGSSGFRLYLQNDSQNPSVVVGVFASSQPSSPTVGLCTFAATQAQTIFDEPLGAGQQFWVVSTSGIVGSARYT